MKGGCPLPLTCEKQPGSSRSLCDCKNGAIHFYGNFAGCCQQGKVVRSGTDKYALGARFARSICCDSDVDVAYLHHSAYGVVAKDPIKCCSQSETVSHDLATQTDRCCPDGQEWNPSRNACSGSCCRDSSDCSSSCQKIEDWEYRINQETCVKEGSAEIGHCKGVSSEPIYPTFGLECVEEDVFEEDGMLKVDNCDRKVEQASIKCISDLKCGSRCSGVEFVETLKRDTKTEKGCSDDETQCEDKPKTLCDVGKVCIEHRSSTTAPVEARCEPCPSTLNIGFDLPTGMRAMTDGLTIHAGQTPITTTTNSLFGPEYTNAENVFRRLGELCDMCPTFDNIHLVGHGSPTAFRFADRPLDADRMKQLVDANPSVRGCMEKFLTTSCNIAAGSFGAAISRILDTEVTAGAGVGRSNCNGFYIGDPQTYPRPCSGGGCSTTTVPRTLYYLTHKDALYPGFIGTAYQVNVVAGVTPEIELEIVADRGDLLIAEMLEENMPCEYTILQEEIVELSASSTTAEIEDLRIRVDSLSAGETSNMRLRELAVDCTAFLERNPNTLSPPSDDDMAYADDLFSKGFISRDYYDDYSYRYDNGLVCTKDEHCMPLRCPMGYLDCKYECRSGDCVIPGNSEFSYVDADGDGLITIQEVVTLVSRWIDHDGRDISVADVFGALLEVSSSDEGLIAHYSFDEGSGAIALDSSGNGFDGTISGATYVQGQQGTALAFDGVDDVVRVSDSEELNFLDDPFTMTAWVRMDVDTGDAPRHIFGKRGPAGEGDWVRFFTSSRKVNFETGAVTIPSSQQYNDGLWHFWAIGRDDQGQLLFVRDEFFYSEPGSFVVYNSGDFTIGRWSGESSFKGAIDEVSVYSRGFSEEELLVLYQQGLS